jgi:DNA-binding GntR family transcriptional regulator
MSSAGLPTKNRLIIDTILGDIASGSLRIGDRITSERQLARQFGISVGTVRRALEQLEHRGVLKSEHGRGTFVRGPGASVDARYLRFRDAAGKDLPVYLHLLARRQIKTTARLEKFFGRRAPLVRIDRRVDVNAQITLLSHFFLYRSDFESLQGSTALKDDSNIRELISQRLALPTLRLEQQVGFERVSATVSNILECAPNTLCFSMELRAYTVGDRPLYLHHIVGEPFEQASLMIHMSS